MDSNNPEMLQSHRVRSATGWRSGWQVMDSNNPGMLQSHRVRSATGWRSGGQVMDSNNPGMLQSHRVRSATGWRSGWQVMDSNNPGMLQGHRVRSATGWRSGWQVMDSNNPGIYKRAERLSAHAEFRYIVTTRDRPTDRLLLIAKPHLRVKCWTMRPNLHACTNEAQTTDPFSSYFWRGRDRVPAVRPVDYRGGFSVFNPATRRNAEVLPKLSRIPSSVEYTSVTT
jgi:hypothetical protein